MEKFELEPALAEEIRSRVFGDGFIKIVQSVRRGGSSFRIALRPVEIGGARRYQAEMVDDGQVQVKNFDADGAAAGLEEIIAQKGARELHLITASGDLHVRVTKKGKALVSRSAPMARAAEVRPHDRVKNLPLNSFDSAALLRAVGIADGEGKIRASMRGKYDQVNEFLKVLADTVGKDKGSSENKGSSVRVLECSRDESRSSDDSTTQTLEHSNTQTLSHSNTPFTVVDCGCGKAYLTFALYFYLTRALGFADVRVVGVDRRADVIDAAKKTAERLDAADKVTFAECDLATFDLASAVPGAKGADMVVSLHACDTATDEALARGVEWKARYILSAPCCQHELQKTIGKGDNAKGASAAFAGLLRQGILRERMCDILTDSFRALILRVLGWRTQVIEFVSPDATARNVLLRAEWGVKPGQGGTVSEYLNLRDFWGVTPWLETRLAKRLEPLLNRYN